MLNAVNPYKRSPTGRYGVSIAAFAMALAVRSALGGAVANNVPFITFFPAVMFSSWYGGLGPGLLVTGLSAIAAQYFYLEPLYSLQIKSFADGLSLVLFVTIGCFISVLNDRKIKAVAEATEARFLAEQRSVQLEREMKQREEAVRREAETKRWASETLSSIGDAVICTDVDGCVTFMNAVAVGLTGWPLEEAKGKALTEIFVIINEDTREPAVNPIRRILQEGLVLGLANHTLLIRRDGTETPIDDSGAPIRDQNRQITGAVLVFRDISERKQGEDQLRRLVNELSHSNEELTTYAHIISHDLQEPLRTITSFSQLLQRSYKDRLDREANAYLDFIVVGTTRMFRLVRDLLTYSRATHPSTQTLAPIRLSDPINWAEHNLEEQLQSSGAIVQCESLPTVMADHVQLVQLFQNLLSNAIKYRSSAPPKIHIRAAETATHWRISVSDNGLGVPTDEQTRIFELFRRGTTDQPGSGIGLAICRRIVSRHGGRIWVESRPDEGSTFHFTLSKDPAGVMTQTASPPARAVHAD